MEICQILDCVDRLDQLSAGMDLPTLAKFYGILDCKLDLLLLPVMLDGCGN